MKIKITKLKEAENPLHPKNIEEGYETIKTIEPSMFREPVVGQCFMVGGFRSSTVQEIIDKNTFRTYNSIYRWEIIE